MVAIVTSCINPKTNSSNARSFVPVAQRVAQTLYSLERLKAVGFKEIILIDNSYEIDFEIIKAAHADVKTFHIQQYQFTNKGINELLMLLTVLDEIPDDQSIFKISGRYFPNESFHFAFDDNFDFRVRAYDFNQKRGTISTRVTL